MTKEKARNLRCGLFTVGAAGRTRLDTKAKPLIQIAFSLSHRVDRVDFFRNLTREPLTNKSEPILSHRHANLRIRGFALVLVFGDGGVHGQLNQDALVRFFLFHFLPRKRFSTMGRHERLTL